MQSSPSDKNEANIYSCICPKYEVGSGSYHYVTLVDVKALDSSKGGYYSRSKTKLKIIPYNKDSFYIVSEFGGVRSF